MKKFINTIFLLLFFLTLNRPYAYSKPTEFAIEKTNDSNHYLQGLASLLFYTIEWEKQLGNMQIAELETENPLITDLELNCLWEKTSHNLYQLSTSENHARRCKRFADAYALYCLAKAESSPSKTSCSPRLVKALKKSLHGLWEDACNEELSPQNHEGRIAITRQKVNLDHNPHIPSKIKKKMRPYVIPVTHPMKNKLDAIFLPNRVTANEQTFAEAGFKTFSIGKRSFVHVARHRLLPHHIVKAYLDNDARKKYGKESWEWIVKRCEGAKRVKKVIKRKNIKHFVVADKWIYPLHAEPSPPMQEGYVRHYAVLLVTDMNLASKDKNFKAWRNKITQEHLDELYIIISRSRGSSYRPDNISLTKEETFAFIDTEYPNNGPDYKSIRLYLNRDMRKYWDKLVKHGGPD